MINKEMDGNGNKEVIIVGRGVLSAQHIHGHSFHSFSLVFTLVVKVEPPPKGPVGSLILFHSQQLAFSLCKVLGVTAHISVGTAGHLTPDQSQT